MLGDEAVDGGLEVDDGVEDAVLEASARQLCEELFHRVQPGAGCGGEVEGPAGVKSYPFWRVGRWYNSAPELPKRRKTHLSG